MTKAIILFAGGLFLLIKGGDWFVDGAAGLARRFRLPELLIGATVVSIGTTLPEVLVSAGAAASGNGGMAYGNAIGSIICNTALIAALTVAIRPTAVARKTLLTPVIFFFIAAAFYGTVAYTGGHFSRLIGILLLLLFAVYMVITVRQAIRTPVPAGEDADHPAAETTLAKELLLLIGGAAIIAVGADLLVTNGTQIAEELGVPQTVISLTFVALGTSLPELVTAVTALIKGHSALSLGNIIGANLFNLVLVSGIATTVSPFVLTDVQEKTLLGHNASLLVDLPVMLGAMLLLCLPSVARQKLSRWQGILLLCIYAGFCAFQFVG